MQQPALSYAITALGIILLAVGLYMRFAIGYHGKAYIVLALGVLVLLGGIAFLVRSPRK
jgi:hypothetical protein